MFLGVTSFAFFVTGVQSVVTSYTICSYTSGGGTCENEISCQDGCTSLGTGNMCPYYTCDCMANAFGLTFGECKSVAGGAMYQLWTCIEDSTDPEPFQGNVLCPAVAGPSEPEPEPEPEPSDSSMPDSTNAPTSYAPTNVPTYAPTYAPDVLCGFDSLCWTECTGDGTCTGSCVTTGQDYEDGYPNCTRYLEDYVSYRVPDFGEWGDCVQDQRITCNRDNTPCENYDMCVTQCGYGDGTCTEDKCYTHGWNLGDGFDNCNGLYTEIFAMFSGFEEWGECFNYEGRRGSIITCNLDVDSETSSSSEADTGLIIGIVVGAVVLIAIIVCLVLYRRSVKAL